MHREIQTDLNTIYTYHYCPPIALVAENPDYGCE